MPKHPTHPHNGAVTPDGTYAPTRDITPQPPMPKYIKGSLNRISTEVGESGTKPIPTTPASHFGFPHVGNTLTKIPRRKKGVCVSQSRRGRWFSIRMPA